ncbi:glycosyltransferase family 4 protein [Akkermansiaceae bacterium]|nr:glycosyltransferase family 4 protein [Akkermansiaceae bacterium]
MKILHLNDHLAAVGGVETYLLGLLPNLEETGHEVVVGYSSGDGSVVNRAEKLSYLGSILHRDIAKGRSELESLIERENPDVVHLHGLQNLGAIQAAVESGRAVMHGHDYRPVCPASNFFYKRTKEICQRTCGPACFAVTAVKHCMTPRPGPASYFYKRVRWVMRNADRFRAIIAPSAGAKNRFVAAGFGADQVLVNPYFCPLPVLKEPRALPENPTVTFLGRASYNKGWEVFIEALGKLPAEVRGLMVGNFSKEDRHEIKRLAQEAGCGDRLDVEGWAGRDAIASLFERTTVLAFPSLWPETLGIVGLEAMANGVPVVASDVGGVREWLVDGETGYCVPAGDADALSAGLRAILEDESSAARMGRAGMERMKGKFAPTRHMETLLEVYQAVGSGERGGK